MLKYYLQANGHSVSSPAFPSNRSQTHGNNQTLVSRRVLVGDQVRTQNLLDFNILP